MASDKTIVLITGANSGIGYATAVALSTSSQTYHVIIASRTAQKAASAMSSIESNSLPLLGTLSTLQLDLDSEQSIRGAAEAVTVQFGRVDVLVNNAGMTPVGEPDLLKQLRMTLRTNVEGTAAVTEAFKPLLHASGDPKVVFLSSSLSSITMRLQKDQKSYRLDGQAYRTSKAAVNMFAACLAANEDIKEDGVKIRVWVVDPGLVATNLTGNAEALKARGAGDPMVSAYTIRDVIEGRRDGDANSLLYKDGVYPW